MAEFIQRHIGPQPADVEPMLKTIGLSSLESLVEATVPSGIRAKRQLQLPAAEEEHDVLEKLRAMASRNQVFKSWIGLGYSNCYTPPVIQRNILENPGWYTQYTPYQAEISQGRLEALLNFQTMVMDLTGMQIANASLLDEATAAAEAMTMSYALKNRQQDRAFFVSGLCNPQTIAVVQTRAEPLGIRVVVGNHEKFDFKKTPVFGALIQYPSVNGRVFDFRGFIQTAHDADALVTMAADILGLCILTPPGELGADIAIGSTQRFGVALGYGGPHAAYLATRDEFKRQAPGRLIGVSKDSDGNAAIRLALQTREQHIRREKATSNICTAQVLLAIMSGMYAVYHGPEGLKKIAERVQHYTGALAAGLRKLGFNLENETFFDTLSVSCTGSQKAAIQKAAESERVNLRITESGLTVSLDETTHPADVEQLLRIFDGDKGKALKFSEVEKSAPKGLPDSLRRKSPYLSHPVFQAYRSETEMLRYIHKLQSKDLSLTSSMIPLGSCTMKLNGTAEMFPVTWPEFANLHPFAPAEQARGYQQLFSELESMLAEITGFDAVSLQPNAGSQGEYSGLLAVRKYHQGRGEGKRDVCLIPQSAHGTNPASAAMAGFRVVVVRCDEHGNVDLNDLKAKAKEHRNELAALMVTYPSTHGVFEEAIREICEVVHEHGGQVYMDGANMNAQVGLCRPGDFGPDVCHLNLHKTFCIPHGGGGPGVGPIAVKKHLAPHLPAKSGPGMVSAAPYGSASILPISYVYIRLMGHEGLKRATEVAILNANYVAKRLDPHYPVLYRGKKGFVAHECIVDLRQIKTATGIEVDDVAKRLMDYGFHAPTVSFPVPGTMMIEPTESESKAELDRFCDAMIAIRHEIAEIEQGKADRKDNVLKNAPHTAMQVTRTEWMHPYPREKAAFPTKWLRDYKFWPPVSRIDAVYGDRNLICGCPPPVEG